MEFNKYKNQEEALNDFLNLLFTVKNNLNEMIEIWEVYFDDDTEDIVCNNYPFEHSFDEVVCDISNWYYSIQEGKNNINKE